VNKIERIDSKFAGKLKNNLCRNFFRARAIFKKHVKSEEAKKRRKAKMNEESEGQKTSIKQQQSTIYNTNNKHLCK
jgi:fructose-1-phosphate kinase PfkB-like protein